MIEPYLQPVKLRGLVSEKAGSPDRMGRIWDYYSRRSLPQVTPLTGLYPHGESEVYQISVIRTATADSCRKVFAWFAIEKDDCTDYCTTNSGKKGDARRFASVMPTATPNGGELKINTWPIPAVIGMTLASGVHRGRGERQAKWLTRQLFSAAKKHHSTWFVACQRVRHNSYRIRTWSYVTTTLEGGLQSSDRPEKTVVPTDPGRSDGGGG
ncbi:hypothetical protein EDB86DRAFT_2830246 [Lactarius hatsudake]|nr:hypothetical protein EDB86DRAFT_2830246 [Lactarius hatsudake]